MEGECTSPTGSDDERAGRVGLDCDAYRSHLKDLDLSPEQENALLGALWHIMLGFADLGFGLDPAQVVLPALMENAWADEENTLEGTGGADLSKSDDGKGRDHE